MTDLSGAIADYLDVRRALGHKMAMAERLLGQFQAYFEQVGATHLTNEIAVAWATSPAVASAGWWNQRLGVLRGFAKWSQPFDPDTEVPPTDLLPGRFRRAVPYLYSDAEVTAMMIAARSLPHPLQQRTYETLTGLLSVSGARIGELIRLDREDVSFRSGVLQVRNSKSKSRQIPLHPSTVEALARYARDRDRLCPVRKSESFFVSTVGTRLLYSTVHPTFKRLTRAAGLRPRSELCRPRIHDLRHTFPVRALVDCYASAGDVQGLLPLLSTWMGHDDPKSTYWYLSAAPELLALVSRRLEAAFESDFEEDQ